jgi:hypothetical protein
LTLSATKSREIHASTPILFAWVGIPLLRFHLHPSHRRSIGQTIGLTAYPPQRAAMFTMPLLTRTCPAYFGWEPYSSLWTSRPHVEPTGPVRACMIRLQRFLGCAPHLSCKGSLTPRLKSGACARANLGHLVTSSLKMLGQVEDVCFSASSPRWEETVDYGDSHGNDRPRNLVEAIGVNA